MSTTNVNNFKLGKNGELLIKHWEELKLAVYPDQGGLPTGGWGHMDKKLKIGTKVSLVTAQAWFSGDTAEAVDAINKLVKVPLTQNQFDALVAFAYNVGVQAFTGSTLLRILNAGGYTLVPYQLKRWDKVDGKVSAGLDNRRAAEIVLWNSKQP